MAELRVGVIGLDTSHAPAFTKLLNDQSDPHYVAGAKVVAAYPTSSADIESSHSRVEGYTNDLRDKYGVQIVDAIPALLEQCDAVLLESVDGRRHLEEARPVIAAKKPLFIDKPLAADFSQARQIVQLAQENDCPFFSSSSLRFDANIAALKNDESIGDVVACDAFSPGSLDPTNPGLFWYGVHGTEILYTLMGQGCHKVLCEASDKYHVVTATWPDGRIATMRATRAGAHDYGVTIFGSKRVAHTLYSREIPLYAQLLNQIVPFFQGGASPIAPDETLEIMAFMQAALVSERENRAVELSEITG